MSRFLIAVSQPLNAIGSRRINDAIAKAGSHFAAQAKWRAFGNTQIGSLIVEADTRSEAIRVVPPSLRQQIEIFAVETAMAA